MLTKRIRNRVEQATIKLPKLGGQDVLVSNNLIITAAHCIEFTCTGKMALGEVYIEPISTSSGSELFVTPWALEPVADIAVLGTLDNQ